MEQDKLAPYYASADVCAFPSLSEPLGRVMFEAMACKAPIVASQVGGLKEHIVNGETGILIPSRSGEELAEAINLILCNPVFADELAEKACQYVNEFTWGAIAQQVKSQIYEPLIDKNTF